MTSFFRRLAIAVGLSAVPVAASAEDMSPMQKHHQVDVVSHDPKMDRVVLSMVETRPWGDHGANLPDLQEKLNAYLNYVGGGQLWRDYPAMKGKKVAFRLHTQFPLTRREEDFVEIVKKKDLAPRDITLFVTPLGAAEKKG